MSNQPDTVTKTLAAFQDGVPQNINPALRELILSIMASPPKPNFDPATEEDHFDLLYSILKSKIVPGFGKMAFPIDMVKAICSQHFLNPTYGSLEWLEQQEKQSRYYFSKKEAMWVSGLVRNADEKILLSLLGKSDHYPEDIPAYLNISEDHPEMVIAKQRFYLPLWWTLQGLMPCFLIAPLPGGIDASPVLTNKVLISLGAIMSYFDLESWGFTIKYLAHDVVCTNGINYRGGWVFADTLSPHWEVVKSALFEEHTLANPLPYDELNRALGRPACEIGQGYSVSLLDDTPQSLLAKELDGYTYSTSAMTINCGPGTPEEHIRVYEFMSRLHKSGSVVCKGLHIKVSSHFPLALSVENARMNALARLAMTHYSRSRDLWQEFEEARAVLIRHAKKHPGDDFEISGFLWPVKEKLGGVEKELRAARRVLRALGGMQCLKRRPDLQREVEKVWRASEQNARVVMKAMRTLRMKCEL